MAQASAEVNVTHYKGQAKITADSCHELSKEIKALKTLSNNKSIADESLFQVDKGGKCSTKGNPLLPSLFAKLNNQSALIDGPNCWNFALRSAGLVKSLRYTEPGEVNSLLNSQMCKSVPNNKVQPGDLAFVKNSFGEHIHAYVYITPNILFAKHAQTAMYNFKLMPMKEMLKSYERTRHCQIKNLHHKDCYNHTVYFRCESFDSYTKKINFNKKAPSTASLFDYIDEIETTLEPLVINPDFKMHNLPKKNTEQSELYKKIADRLETLIALTTILSQYSSFDTFSQSDLTKAEQYFFQRQASMRIQSIYASAHGLLRNTSQRRKMDKSLYKDFKNALKHFQSNNKWSQSDFQP